MTPGTNLGLTGEGRIIRPVPLSPRAALSPSGNAEGIASEDWGRACYLRERILKTLRALDLGPVLERAGGLEVEQDWDNILSLGEQQLLAVARILFAAPRFAFLDRPGTALSPGQVDLCLKMLSKNSISYLTMGGSDEPLDNYDAVLELAGDGGWKWIQTGEVIDKKCPR